MADETGMINAAAIGLEIYVLTENGKMVNASTGQIDTQAEDFTVQGNLAAWNRYHEKFLELMEVMELYKELMDEDRIRVENILAELEEAEGQILGTEGR